MNIKLLQENLNLIASKAQQNQAAEAVGTAMAVVKLLLSEPVPGKARDVYGAYGGMAVRMRECFDTLLTGYKPSEDFGRMMKNIEQVNLQIDGCAKEAAELTAKNSELLAQEAALKEAVKQLEDLKEKIAGLQKTKDTVYIEIDKSKQQLADLEKACSEAQAERDKWLLVFDENSRLIAALPDSVADKTADALIAKAKAYRDQARKNAEEGDEYLRKVIAALETVKKGMEGTA